MRKGPGSSLFRDQLLISFICLALSLLCLDFSNFAVHQNVLQGKEDELLVSSAMCSALGTLIKCLLTMPLTMINFKSVNWFCTC